MSLLKDLENIGLTEKEARVYLATLELAQSSVQDIAKKAVVNRTTTYVILDSLIKKGLASTYQKEKKIYYMAESPETLGSLFALQKKEIEEKQKYMQTLLPELRAIYNRQEDKPTVRFFEGKEGLRTMINEMMSCKDKVVRMIYSVDNLIHIFNQDEVFQARQIRIQKKINTKVLYTKKQGELQSTPDGERIKISEGEFPISADIALFDNKVRIASLGGKKLSGVIIQDEEIYKTLVSLFELAWEAAKNRSTKNKM